MKDQVDAEAASYGKGLDELTRLEVNWDVIVFGICREMVANVGKSHGTERMFTRKVKRTLEEMGVGDGTGLGRGEEEWKKLRRWAAEVE